MTISQVQLLDDGSEREVFRRTPREEMHLHERWELSIPSGAPLRLESREAPSWIPSDGAVLIAPGSVHRLGPVGEDDAGLERWYIRPSTARAALPARVLAGAEVHPIVIAGPHARDWTSVLTRHRFDPSANDDRSAAQPPHGGLVRAVSHLEANLDRTVSLDELSKACGLSKFHLCRMFHRLVGVTPRTYHRHIRLERGRALLHAGRPASLVAEDLSFSDQSHFIRSFRKQFGVTPGDFVNARRTRRHPGGSESAA